MEKLAFNIRISASPERVWNVLIGEETYPEWTRPFCDGARVETDWKKGSKALFVDGNNSGMVSVIAENIPGKYLSIKHLGEVKNGVEDTESDKVKQWSGIFENYTLNGSGEQTDLVIDGGIPEAYADYMKKAWPKALQLVKELSEK